jgi:16S rRNA (guanine527-N7)-methyltransferase
MPLPDLVKIVRKNIARDQRNALPNGILCLKGGNLQDETAPFRNIIQVQSLSQWFAEEWFQEKYCIYLPL